LRWQGSLPISCCGGKTRDVFEHSSVDDGCRPDHKYCWQLACDCSHSWGSSGADNIWGTLLSIATSNGLRIWQLQIVSFGIYH
jgi:hypothetical protein